ncbi:hypothetical protein AWM68_14790 [Fictibacillus phosphorivorans]|uniref:Uncharacterized protein n=1 Tax=Fictibacillus phosphorivorans TaxID=1221500 RepID=A0A163PZB4_9BACL|nr:hypothetical protein AWM68_14790 [Fictibacillus phosphorivorans]
MCEKLEEIDYSCRAELEHTKQLIEISLKGLSIITKEVYMKLDEQAFGAERIVFKIKISIIT